MGRWDALCQPPKEKMNDQGKVKKVLSQKKSPANVPASNFNLQIHNYHAGQFTKVLRKHSTINEMLNVPTISDCHEMIDLSEDTLFEYRRLMANCRSTKSDVSYDDIGSLCKLIMQHGYKLPPTSLAHEAAQDILIPHLEKHDFPHPTVFAAIDFLLQPLVSKQCQRRYGLQQQRRNQEQHNKTSLIMMAPVVQDISKEGNDCQAPNPIRCYLFRVLQQKLLTSLTTTKHDDLQSQCSPEEVRYLSCQTMTAALHATFIIDETKRLSKSFKLDVNAIVIRNFVLQMFRLDATMDRSSANIVWNLLLAFLRYHPEAATTFIILVMEELPTSAISQLGQKRKCRNLSCSFLAASSPLLTAIHADSSPVAVACLVKLVQHFPFDLWFPATPQSDFVSSKNMRTSNFQDRILAGLCVAFQIITCRLSRIKELNENIEQLADLAKELLIKTPFHYKEVSLHKTALQLMQLLMEMIMLKHSDQNASASLLARETILQVTGGQMTPHGELTKMSVLWKDWLGTTPGHNFVCSQLATFQARDASNEMTSTIRRNYQLLASIFRMYPALVVCNEHIYTCLSKTIIVLTNSVDKLNQVAALEMIVALLLGRRDSERIKSTNHILAPMFPFLSNHLLMSLLSDHESCQKLASRGFGCLLACDWDFLESKPIVDRILFLCHYSSLSVNTRAESCKAVGDICTEYFSVDRQSVYWNSEGLTLCSDVLSVMIKLTKDASPTIRSMSAFAIGNLTQTLFSNKDFSFSNNILKQLFGSTAFRIKELLTDSDEKVVANAIRSIGHLGSHLLCWGFANGTYCVDSFLDSVLESLEEKVRSTIKLALNESSSEINVSWKRRLAAKKHGRGACNAVSLLFDAGIVNVVNLEILRKMLSTLLQCIEHLDYVNEKVVLSAIAALQSFNRSYLVTYPQYEQRLSGHVSHCLVSVVASRFNADLDVQLSEKMIRDLDTLLLQLLYPRLVAEEICNSFQPGKITNAQLEALVSWMEKRSCPAQMFNMLIVLLRNAGISLDIEIDIAQSFAAQATTENLYQGFDSANENEL